MTTSELLRIVLDPDELGALYNRCVRCLYLRYRGNVAAVGQAPHDWADSVVGFHSEESWIELRGSKFRFRTYGEQVESQAIAYADCGVSLARVFQAFSRTSRQLPTGCRALSSICTSFTKVPFALPTSTIR